MGSKWSEFKLEELAAPGKSSLSTGPFGSAISAKFFQENGVPVIRGGNLSTLTSERMSDDGLVFVSHEKAKEFNRSIARYGDLIFTCWGTINQVGLIDDSCRYSEYVISNKQMKVTLDRKKADPLFLYYVFSSPLKQSEILKNGIGAAVPGFNLGQLKAHKLMLPPVSEQTKIAGFLNGIDKKITLNRQINQTLEQMAQTLFKSWFVDFDPVVDNALDAGFFEQDLALPDELLRRSEARRSVREQGGFKSLPDAICQLFPAAFEECVEPSVGLGGWVPKGWRPSNIGAEFDVTMGQSPPGSTYNESGEGMPFFQGKTDFGFRFPCNRIYCTEPKRMARKNDTLVSVRAPVGDINLATEDCAIGRGIAAVRHKSGSISFSYYAMNNLSTHFKVFEGEGTVFGSINQKDFKELPLIKCPAQVVSKFDEVCGCWDKRIENLTIEAAALTKLRDTLLPKLISGELRLDQIEADLAKEGMA